MKWIIEVQKICDTNDEKIEYEHLGYINMIFRTNGETKKYVKAHNPRVRFKGNRRKGFYTSTDPLTNLRFMIRSYRDEKLSLNPY